ncbi:ABC transporter permease [Brevibacillus sp. H7]|uniref:ABC transporter permease n=1 Tax=Brevibacillus sp. H7 TaxID=3349138 RepID=UPI0037F56843
MRSRMNISLWIGSILVLFLIGLGILGPYVAPYEVDFQEKLRNETVNGKTVIISPPLPPSEDHLFGTDKWGYDLFTLLLHGARYTVFVTMAVAFLRVVAGTLIGLYIGMQERQQRWWISIENAWSYIPIFIPVYFLLIGININSELSTAALVTIFISLVTLLGIPSVVSSIRQKTEQIKEMQYVLAATSLGAGRSQLIFRHILPHLKEQIAVIFVMEIIAVMTLMGLLGMFNLFVGGTKMTTDPVIYHSITHEWAGLLGSYRGFIYSAHTWIYMTPLAAFIFAISSFTLLAKGLRDRFQHTYHRAPFI